MERAGEAKKKFPHLNLQQLTNLVAVAVAVEELTATLKPGETVSRDAVRLHMSKGGKATRVGASTVENCHSASR
jgi:hypothetical protein